MIDNIFRPVSVRRGFEEVLEQFEGAILEGHLSAGDRLPPERELAAKFGISRNSVREALRVFEALGVVKVQRGAETGGSIVRREPGDAFVQLLKLYLLLKHISIEHVVDMLIVISSWAARKVASSPKHEEIAADLGKFVTSMKKSGQKHESYDEIDAEFHVAVVAAAGNELANLVMEGCSSALRRLIRAPFAESPVWDSIHNQRVKEHSRIVRAIKSGDASGAENLMQRHIRTWSDRAIEVARLNEIPLT
ncbi:FCD domain-containing protein [Hyphomicrobium sp.]|uniref:FadR/GntR family transcriptional regulator n=1 Tax=Hyphomicrobium sp. TaxID=82 RepID=UPI001DD1E201|nr:FCD domain-containing protein [Hyphomicrobium sp.]MBY0558783.1 FCD domain-containing protein [Hyphomicrobium sp.]